MSEFRDDDSVRASYKSWMDGFVAGGCVGMMLTILVVMSVLLSGCVTSPVVVVDKSVKCDDAVNALFQSEFERGGTLVSQGAGIDGIGVVVFDKKAGTFRKFIITPSEFRGAALTKEGYERVLQCFEPVIDATVSVYRFIEPVSFPEGKKALIPVRPFRVGETVSPKGSTHRFSSFEEVGQ